MSSPSGNSSVSRAGSVNASTSVQNWSVNRPSVIPEHPKKQKITISIHNKLPVRQGQSQPSLHGPSLDTPSKPVPSSTVTSSAMQSTSSASMTAVSSKVTKQMTPSESCSKPVMNGKSKLRSSVLVPYGAESSEESDEEAKGLGKENGLGTIESSNSSVQDAEDDEASPLELREPVALNGADSPDSDLKENGLPCDGARCPVQPALHSENPFSKANGLPGKVSILGVRQGAVGGELCLDSHVQPFAWLDFRRRPAAARAERALFFVVVDARSPAPSPGRQHLRDLQTRQQSERRHRRDKVRRSTARQRNPAAGVLCELCVSLPVSLGEPARTLP